MEELIREKLLEIEKEHNIEILYACESGSRAWGFPSPNSDYDVRFIYAQGLDWHLSLRERKDTIDLPINDDLDIGGWEIKKALQLLWKSNAPLLEWIQSPIVYKAEQTFLSQLREISQCCFSPIATMHHYQSMAKKYYEACDAGEVKLKKYFYALRTAISAAWIRERMAMPHIELPKMLGIVNETVKNRIEELIKIKAKQNENYLHPQEPLIYEFLKSSIEKNEQVANDLPSAKGDIEMLDDFYRNVVKGVYK